MVKEALKTYGLDPKSVLRTKNMFALGMVYWLFDRKLKYTEQFFEKKFAQKPEIAEANKVALRAGYYYAETIEALNPVIQIRACPDSSRNLQEYQREYCNCLGFSGSSRKSRTECFYRIIPDNTCNRYS